MTRVEIVARRHLYTITVTDGMSREEILELVETAYKKGYEMKVKDDLRTKKISEEVDRKRELNRKWEERTGCLQVDKPEVK